MTLMTKTPLTQAWTATGSALIELKGALDENGSVAPALRIHWCTAGRGSRVAFLAEALAARTLLFGFFLGMAFVSRVL